MVGAIAVSDLRGLRLLRQLREGFLDSGPAPVAEAALDIALRLFPQGNSLEERRCPTGSESACGCGAAARAPVDIAPILQGRRLRVRVVRSIASESASDWIDNAPRAPTAASTETWVARRPVDRKAHHRPA
jgi:hypothetical protein